MTRVAVDVYCGCVLTSRSRTLWCMGAALTFLILYLPGLCQCRSAQGGHHLHGMDDMDVYEEEKQEYVMNSLNLWIDGREIEQFVGVPVPMDIFVIREGMVVPYLQDDYLTMQLPVIPPNIHVVKLTWQGSDDTYYYNFSDLRSLDPMDLYDPLLSIPPSGTIPRTKTDFHITIPCTGRVTSVASMYIVLHISNSHGKTVPGSPIKLHVRKTCLAFDSRAVCKSECENGGKCNDVGQCDCAPGYYGSACHLAVCFPECGNNGTCVTPGKCQCPVGFYGQLCQYAVCKTACMNGGTCVEPELCDCPKGYYGQYCQHKTGTCKIPCKNGGTCTMYNYCRCETGYMGDFCQKPVCRRSCGVHGRCVDVDQCECYRGWRGRYCHKTINRMHKYNNHHGKRKRRKKDRQLRFGRGFSSGSPNQSNHFGHRHRKRRHRKEPLV